MTLSGIGSVQLSNFLGNRIKSATLTNDILTNQGNTISGAGLIGNNSMNLNNQGTIRAITGSPLIINPSNGGVTNSGTIETFGPNTIVLDDGVFDNTGGIISANNGGTIQVTAIVSGGTFNITSLSTLLLSGSITGGTLNNSGEVLVPAGTTGTLGGAVNNTAMGLIQLGHSVLVLTGGAGNTYFNAGTIALNSTLSFTDLVIQGDVTISGSGRVQLSNFAGNRIYGATATSILTNQGNTISGAGFIGNNRARSIRAIRLVEP